MMGIAAKSDKCRILITMRFKVPIRCAPEDQQITSARQRQDRRAFEKKYEMHFADRDREWQRRGLYQSSIAS